MLNRIEVIKQYLHFCGVMRIHPSLVGSIQTYEKYIGWCGLIKLNPSDVYSIYQYRFVHGIKRGATCGE